MTWKEDLFKASHEKSAVQRQIARRLFDAFQAVGFHLTADHFYDSIPNTRLIDRNYSNEERDCTGIDFRFTASEEFLHDLLTTFSKEITEGVLEAFGYVNANWYFKHLDALALYALVRTIKPQRIVEVGQGMSTRVIVSACQRNWKDNSKKIKFITVDPYARLDVLGMADSPSIEMETRQADVQSCNLSLFTQLQPNDLLFIDSSHVFKSGSDVAFEFEHIYPNLPKGVILHIHDIFSPFDYPKNWMVKRKQFWNEQYFLETLIRFNPTYEVLLPLHFLARRSNLIKRCVEDRFAGLGFELEGQSLYLRRK